MKHLRKLKDPRIGTGRYILWLNQGKFDLQAAEKSIEAGFYEWSTYQTEQAVEKALKSIILHAGYIPPKIHKLSVLIGYCNSVNERFKNTKFEFRDIDAFTFISRYPFLLPEAKLTPHEQIKKKDAQNLLEQGKSILHKIEDIIEGREHKNHEESRAYEGEEIPMDLDNRLDMAVSALQKAFDLKKVILFGSYARKPELEDDRTIDLLIIANTTDPFVTRIIKARESTGGYKPIIEPLVYTPTEFKTLVEDEGEGFFENAIREGREIFNEESNK